MAENHRPRFGILIVILVASLILSSLSCYAPITPPKAIRFADTKGDSTQVHNRIAGYIVRWGYDYHRYYIPCEDLLLFTALATGDLDVHMECYVENMREVYEEAINSGDVLDLGTNFGDSRIVVSSRLLDEAPEIVEFLRKYETTVEQNNEFLANIDEAGTLNAAAWFLRNRKSVWTKWVPPDVAQKVKTALESGSVTPES